MTPNSNLLNMNKEEFVEGIQTVIVSAKPLPSGKTDDRKRTSGLPQLTAYVDSSPCLFGHLEHAKQSQEAS